ncbi:MAG: ABC transporter permease [Caldilineaceae bacterium]|nr:ABC transporter permease [Caldilineaceae bacterium]
MLAPRWRKVIFDLWDHKMRTLLVILSIAVGVLAVGMIAGSRAILAREMHGSWRAVNPAGAVLYTGAFDQTQLETVRRLPGVGAADARLQFGVRFKTLEKGVDPADSPWRSLGLITVPDYDHIEVFTLTPESGAWPPPPDQVVLERASLAWMGVSEGDEILIELSSGKQRTLTVAGSVYDIMQQSGSWTGQGIGYISPVTLDWLGMTRYYDQLNLITAEQPYDIAHIRQVAEGVADHLEKGDVSVNYIWVDKPGMHPADSDVQPVMLILGVLGALSLVLSGFMVTNAFQALLTQQVRQIGVMKAVGAKRRQIMGVYVALVGLLALLALAVGMPLGLLGAYGLANFVANLVNFDILSYAIDTRVWLLELLVGLGVPLAAAFLPIRHAVNITVREAMSDQGMNLSRRGSFFDRVLRRIRGLSRPYALSLRNTFRRKTRLGLTLTTLILGGGIFIAVFTVRASLLATLDDMFDYIDYDVLVVFNRAYRTERLLDQAYLEPGVTAAEGWRMHSVRRVRPDGTESDNIALRAPAPGSALINPTLAAGRWLLPGDANAVVVNTNLRKDEPDISVGRAITLTMGGEESAWMVVGLVQGTPPQPLAYVDQRYFTSQFGGIGRNGALFVATNEHDAATQTRVAEGLEARYEAAGISVGRTLTSATEESQIVSQFNVLVGFLLIMAVLLAVVGAIGLMGAMSLNVIERTREIGVLRAIGAGNQSIFRIVTAEALLIGGISWTLAIVVSLPLSMAMNGLIGASIMQAPLTYRFSLMGVFIWLALIAVLSFVASLLPARSATSVSVRDTLAYE